jgi:hypothetical protein
VNSLTHKKDPPQCVTSLTREKLSTKSAFLSKNSYLGPQEQVTAAAKELLENTPSEVIDCTATCSKCNAKYSAARNIQKNSISVDLPRFLNVVISRERAVSKTRYHLDQEMTLGKTCPTTYQCVATMLGTAVTRSYSDYTGHYRASVLKCDQENASQANWCLLDDNKPPRQGTFKLNEPGAVTFALYFASGFIPRRFIWSELTPPDKDVLTLFQQLHSDKNSTPEKIPVRPSPLPGKSSMKKIFSSGKKVTTPNVGSDANASSPIAQAVSVTLGALEVVPIVPTVSSVSVQDTKQTENSVSRAIIYDAESDVSQTEGRRLRENPKPASVLNISSFAEGIPSENVKPPSFCGLKGAGENFLPEDVVPYGRDPNQGSQNVHQYEYYGSSRGGRGRGSRGYGHGNEGGRGGYYPRGGRGGYYGSNSRGGRGYRSNSRGGRGGPQRGRGSYDYGGRGNGNYSTDLSGHRLGTHDQGASQNTSTDIRGGYRSNSRGGRGGYYRSNSRGGRGGYYRSNSRGGRGGPQRGRGNYSGVNAGRGGYQNYYRGYSRGGRGGGHGQPLRQHDQKEDVLQRFSAQYDQQMQAFQNQMQALLQGSQVAPVPSNLQTFASVVQPHPPYVPQAPFFSPQSNAIPTVDPATTLFSSTLNKIFLLFSSYMSQNRDLMASAVSEVRESSRKGRLSDDFFGPPPPGGFGGQGTVSNSAAFGQQMQNNGSRSSAANHSQGQNQRNHQAAAGGRASYMNVVQKKNCNGFANSGRGGNNSTMPPQHQQKKKIPPSRVSRQQRSCGDGAGVEMSTDSDNVCPYDDECEEADLPAPRPALQHVSLGPVYVEKTSQRRRKQSNLDQARRQVKTKERREKAHPQEPERTVKGVKFSRKVSAIPVVSLRDTEYSLCDRLAVMQTHMESLLASKRPTPISKNGQMFIQWWRRNFEGKLSGSPFEKTWVVYCAIHIPSNQKYVGSTKFTVMKRFREHVEKSRTTDSGRTGLSNMIDHCPALCEYIVLPLERASVRTGCNNARGGEILHKLSKSVLEHQQRYFPEWTSWKSSSSASSCQAD